jgi:hypothetical protein
MKRRSTITDRRLFWHELGKLFDRLEPMSDAEIFAEAKKRMPSLTEATRAECLKMLVMDHAYKMIE